MNHIALHYTFVGQGCAGIQVSQPAATVEAGAMWMDVYNAVTTMAGRYVQGGCATVGKLNHRCGLRGHINSRAH